MNAQTITRISVWIFLSSWLLTYSLVAQSKDAELTPVSLQLNWNHQFQFAGYYAALQQGYYQEAGLDVEIKGWKSGIDPLTEVKKERVDFAVGYGSMVTDFIKGEPIRFVMSAFQYSPLVLLSHRPIQRFSDLSNQTIMYYDSLQVDTFLKRAESELKHPIKRIPSSGNLQDFIDKKVDLYGAYATNEPSRLDALGVAYHIVDPKQFGIQTYGDFIFTHKKNITLKPAAVSAFKQASIRGWQYAVNHPEKVVDYIIKHYPVVKTKQQLMSEAKLTLPYIRMGNTQVGHIAPIKLLSTALNAKEIGLITAEELNRFKPEDAVFNGGNALLTEQELKYLAERGPIQLANDIDWAPFEFIDEKGRYQGMAADYLNLIEDKFGIEFDFVRHEPWSDVVTKTKQGMLDVYSCAVATPERSTYMNFTEPYLSVPMVLIGSETSGYRGRYSDLTSERVAVVKGYWSHEFLKNNFPNLELVVVNSVKEGLQAVIFGQADVYSGNLAAIDFAMREHGLNHLKVVGQSKESFNLSLGVRQDDPLLFSILSKALASITQAERQAIYNNWVKLRVVKQLDSKQIKELIIIAMFLLVLILAVLFTYAYQKRQQKRYIEQINELSYATLIDLEDEKVIWVTDSFCRLSGYSKEELIGQSYESMKSCQLTREMLDALKQDLLAGKSWTGEVDGYHRDGSTYCVDLTLTPQKDVLGKYSQVLATRVDVSAKKLVEILSITDELTGLYNRRYFNQTIEKELNRTRRDEAPLSIAMIDLDYFKHINDTFGHDEGDRLLVLFADILNQHFNRANDFVFRMGGEEFLVISHFKSRLDFFAHLNKLKQDLEEQKIPNPSAPLEYVTMSVGALFLEADEIGREDEIYHDVDAAMYQAKQEGRNRIIFHEH